ncbi:MAG: hypothetical protein ACU0A5_23525 [Salipiger marinus]|uniref:hypothetical protein n=1 Tax=Salipiger marinus TaxID=555512 RepID=UPI0040599CB5
MKKFLIPATVIALAAACLPQDRPSAAVPEGTIPAALQGQWGLVAADCEPGRDDAKGLLTVEPERLVFYESRATLGDVTEATPSRIAARFNFSGEGMTWSRDILLEQSGDTLTRRETGEGAIPEPLVYSRCP